MLVFCVAVGAGLVEADNIPVIISGSDGAVLDGLPVSLSGLVSDPEWTTLENVELTDNLFSLVETLGGDSADIAALFAPGAIFATANLVTTAQPPTANSISAPQAVSNVPEPVTMSFPGAAFLFLIWYARRRLRKIDIDHININHGALQQSD